ncbi:hypothetical protein TEA_014148 [Camellia sinensis var. sinensis]|uniref:Uncharacterized protein n=1 Tax=Camellia sinensis var. sinensis TaxID=542762 RepID=A0A4V3WL00_CAMSN|nr:hypothetical protein TEA_014148 [Camellia sinensis var. sinensis]
MQAIATGALISGRRLLAHNYRKGITLLPLVNFNFNFNFNPLLSADDNTLLFHTQISTNSNPNPNPNPNPNLPDHRKQLPKFLLDKSELGFGKLDDALSLFHRMVQMQPLPSVIQFTQLLTDYGFSVLSSFFKLGYVPCVSTFTTLMNGFILPDKTGKAMELFNKLVREGEIKPDRVMYGTIINGLSKTGNTTTAIGILRSMRKWNYKPDVVMYNIIIDGLCKDKNVDDALSLLVEMNQQDVTPDLITYNTLIHGLCNLGRWEEATRMLRDMTGKNVFPDVLTFNTLINAFCKEGMAKEAENVLEFMVQRGVGPNVVTYNTLMDGYCLLGHMDRAIEVFHSMVDKGIEPNILCYNILINGYCKNMKIEEAMNVFREMPRKGLKPTIDTYNTMLQGLFGVGRCSTAQGLLNEMQANGQSPDYYTYCVLLDGLSKNGHIDEALLLFQELECSGVNPGITMHNILIDRLCKDGKLEMARNLFGKLDSKGLRPDVRTFTMMIGGFCEQGLLGEANDLLVTMEGTGCMPNYATYNVMVRGFLKANDYTEANILAEKMIGRGFSADASTLVTDSKVNLGTSVDSYANMEEILRCNRFSTKFEFIYRQTCSFTKVEGYLEIIALMVTETIQGTILVVNLVQVVSRFSSWLKLKLISFCSRAEVLPHSRTLVIYLLIPDSDIFGNNLGLAEITSASRPGHVAPRLTRRCHLGHVLILASNLRFHRSRLPLDILFREIIHYYKLNPIQLAINSYRVINALPQPEKDFCKSFFPSKGLKKLLDLPVHKRRAPLVLNFILTYKSVLPDVLKRKKSQSPPSAITPPTASSSRPDQGSTSDPAEQPSTSAP